MSDIIVASITVLAEGGVAALEMKTVSEKLSIRPPSLYNHVRNVEELRVLVAHAGARTLLQRFESGSQRKRSTAGSLRHMAAVYRDFALENPGWYELMYRVLPRPNRREAVKLSESVLAPLVSAFEQLGLGASDTVHSIRALRAAIHGFILLELSGALQLKESVEMSFSRMVDDLIEAAKRRGRGPRPAVAAKRSRKVAQRA
jgi:AcrR family transcriptional regulator